jgi:hypothetical protein
MKRSLPVFIIRHTVARHVGLRHEFLDGIAELSGRRAAVVTVLALVGVVTQSLDDSSERAALASQFVVLPSFTESPS